MGKHFDFKCENCDFTARCSHGRDRGFVALVQPLYCVECKVLKNIHIGNYVRGTASDYKIEDLMPVCGKCNQTETLKVWDGKTCPKCENSPLLMRETLICWD